MVSHKSYVKTVFMKNVFCGFIKRTTDVKACGTRTKLFVVTILLFSLFGFKSAHADEYPSQPIRMLIGYSAGGVIDTLHRIIAQEACKILGQDIVPTNAPGGGGSVAAGILSKSEPDGYTIVASSDSLATTVPHMQTLSYDPFNDLVPIVQTGVINNGIAVRSDSPHTSLKSLIEFSRENPGKVSCAVPGIGIPPHLAMQLVMQEEKVRISVVPYKGTNEAIPAILGGHVTSIATSLTGILQYQDAGKVRLLATTSAQRFEGLPDVPTLVEMGYKDGEIVAIYMIWGNKGTPSAVLDKLRSALLKAIETPAVQRHVKDLNLAVARPMYGRELEEFIRRQYEKNERILRGAKLGRFK